MKWAEHVLNNKSLGASEKIPKLSVASQCITLLGTGWNDKCQKVPDPMERVILILILLPPSSQVRDGFKGLFLMGFLCR